MLRYNVIAWKNPVEPIENVVYTAEEAQQLKSCYNHAGFKAVIDPEIVPTVSVVQEAIDFTLEEKEVMF